MNDENKIVLRFSILVLAAFSLICAAYWGLSLGLGYVFYHNSTFDRIQTAQFESCMNKLESGVVSDEMREHVTNFCDQIAKRKAYKSRLDFERLVDMSKYCEGSDSIHFENGQPDWGVKGKIVYDYLLMKQYDCNTESYSDFQW
ncbi:hypothetical protein JYB88_10535 [Shewanella cyperi]|uniref:Uncharacterized protein n=1 Tax=Shewanella cyperi TaxID=2814292 RepID=A0A975AIY1_9GAMM|nr:hypothetical protein [Shewanella cyperi]QSX28722.1 hypothetical protein JYB88_10535 [Shewanella cyperi]